MDTFQALSQQKLLTFWTCKRQRSFRSWPGRHTVLLRRPLAARPVLGHEIDPVLGFEKRLGFATDCCAPAMVC